MACPSSSPAAARAGHAREIARGDPVAGVAAHRSPSSFFQPQQLEMDALQPEPPARARRSVLALLVLKLAGPTVAPPVAVDLPDPEGSAADLREFLGFAIPHVGRPGDPVAFSKLGMRKVIRRTESGPHHAPPPFIPSDCLFYSTKRNGREGAKLV